MPFNDERMSLMYQPSEKYKQISFDAFNESEDLAAAVERYKERTSYYPERVLVDQIYRTRANRCFC